MCVCGCVGVGVGVEGGVILKCHKKFMKYRLKNYDEREQKFLFYWLPCGLLHLNESLSLLFIFFIS